MCEATQKNGSKCRYESLYWVMTNREVSYSGNGIVDPFKSRTNLLVCASHLARAVRELGKLNRDAWSNHPFADQDGVTVKTRTFNPVNGWACWS